MIIPAIKFPNVFIEAKLMTVSEATLISPTKMLKFSIDRIMILVRMIT